MGQSILKLNSSKYIFEELKKYLISINKVNTEWNSLNILSTNASTVGAYDLNIFSSNSGDNLVIKKIKNHEFDIIFLFGQDNVNFEKKNEFIVYVGSHGDKGADLADIILPAAAYTEQDGYFTNLEGKLQKAYKASYPTGEAKEDWEIINDLSELLKRKKIFKNKNELIDNMFNYLKNKNEAFSPNNNLTNFSEEDIFINSSNYYFSNVIARSSKTMSDCYNSKIKLHKTGTEG